MNESHFKRFVNKTTAFKFNQQTLRLQLSQSLFSSADVDDGSRILLQSILQQVDLTAVHSILDIGCGVGVLGLSLVNGRRQTSLSVQDRDALALTFTQANAALNNIGDLELLPGLGFQGLNGRRFDLIVSNLPGKAGEPVLQALLHQMPGHLTATGTAAIVVVNPLADLIASTLTQMGSQLLFQTSSQMHTIFIFRAKMAQESLADSFPGPFLRGRAAFQAENFQYELDTVYNLPDFDTLGYDIRLALKMCDKEKLNGRVLFWNPGQGHLPVAAAQLPANHISHYSLGSRDSLSLQIAAHNLQLNGVQNSISCHHQPTLLELTGPFDNLVILPDDDPGVPWSNLLPKAAAALLPTGGKLLLIGKTGFIGRFLAERNKLRPLRQKKYHGYKAVWLEKVKDNGN